MDPSLSDGSILCAEFSDGPLFYLMELEYFSHSLFSLVGFWFVGVFCCFFFISLFSLFGFVGFFLLFSLVFTC